MEMPKEWFASPKFAFVIGGAMGIAAGVSFAMAYLYPAHESRLRTEIDEARQVRGQYEAIAKQNAELKKSLLAAQKGISDAYGKNLLSVGSPYPVGFDQVKLGNQVDAVNQRYAHLKIEKQDKYWSVSPQGGVLESVTYYFDPSTRSITHIAFRFGPIDGTLSATLRSLSSKGEEMLDQNFLLRQLVRALGQPGYSVGIYQKWTLPSGEGVYANDKERYILMRAGYMPAEWPTTSSTKK